MSATASIDGHVDTYPFIDPAHFSGSLHGQVALVTGAGRGVGRAIALAFAHAGANVVCLARTTHEIRDVVNSIACKTTAEALAISADVSRDEDIQDALQQIQTRFGHVDILVNNAGIDRIGAFEHESDFSAWWHVLEVNLRGPMALIHQVLPEMLRRDHGVIISIGSRNAVYNFPFMTAYSAAKTALLRIHQCLHLEIAKSGVCDYYLQPGDVATSLMRDSVDWESAEKTPALKQMLSTICSQMTGPSTCSPELAANTCIMLAAHPDAHMLSGMYLDADRDLCQLLEDVKKGKDGRILNAGLYNLKIDRL